MPRTPPPRPRTRLTRPRTGTAPTAHEPDAAAQPIQDSIRLGWARVPPCSGGALDKAIGADRDAPMATLEAMTYLAAAMAITSLA